MTNDLKEDFSCLVMVFSLVFGSWEHIVSKNVKVSFKLYMYIYIPTYVFHR